MKSYQLHVLILFLSLALAVTILVDGVTHLSMARFDFPNGPDGKAAYTNLMMYETIVPVLSVLGLLMHIFGLHLDFVSYLPDTPSEGLFMLLGTAAHGAAWLTMGSMWTACEVGAISLRKQTINGQTVLFYGRNGPAFCPQHKFLDKGVSLEGPIPKIKVALAWTLFVCTVACLACAFRGWRSTKGVRERQDNARHRRTMGPFEMSAYSGGPSGTYPGRSATMEVLGAYETKV